MPKPSVKSSPTASGSGVESESAEIPRRRSFSAAYKRRIVKEADACRNRGDVGALLRREGIYSSHLTNWRREFEAGGTAALAGKKRGRKPKKTAEQKRIEQLEKEKAKLEDELYVARALIDLQKKASVLLGITLPSPPEGDGES